MLNLRLPANETHWLNVKEWIEPEPEPGYQHAPLEAIEAFNDIKYAVRIHWGLYSLWQLQGESWPFLEMPFDQRQEYQQLYRQFNPTGFDAEQWMTLFQRAGLKCFAITAKHHEGFALWDTQTRVRQRVNYTAPGGPQIETCDLAYSVMETPFRRDILKELCDAARKYGIKIDFYFSHPDWYDADFRPYCFHPLQTRRAAECPEEYGNASYQRALSERVRIPAPERTPAETARMIQRHRQQLTELLTRYGPIDLLCLDMWLGADVWPELRRTIYHLRQLQPKIMLRARGIGNYGDYYTPEGFVPGDPANTDMPWMVIYPLARSFSYDPEGKNYKGWQWIVRNIIDCTAKGGNFMVSIGPDSNGRFHPQAVRDLERAGDWLRVCGEAIYATRPRSIWQEGRHIRFTRSKDGRLIYALLLKWPGQRLTLRSIFPSRDLRVMLVGYDRPLSWQPGIVGTIVDLPAELRDPRNRPCEYAYAFRIEGAIESQ